MKKSLFTLCFIAVGLSVFAQTKKVVADKIIATIGDKIILKSDIDNSIHDMKRNNIPIPPNANCLLLEQALAVKALVVQAERDSIPIDESEIEAEIENRIRYFVRQYGSKEILEQISGKSIFQLKESFREPFREQKLAQAERNKIVENIRVTPKEVQEYYNKIPKDSLHFYESELEVGQIVIYPKPSRELENYAINQLKQYKKEVEEGSQKFEILASLYTDDPGSKETGGLYEINRNEQVMDPLFIAKAFSLKEGQISSVFKTQFGYHIIQMVSRRGDDATIRHILKIPQVSSIEVNLAIDKLDSIRTQLINGSLEFGQAVAKYSEDESSKFTGGRITSSDRSQQQQTLLTIDQFDKDLVLMFDSLDVGEYSTATQFTDLQGKKGVRIVQILTKTKPHRENLKDDYDEVSNRVLEVKKNAALEKWFTTQMATFYVNVDPEYQSCTQIKKWMDDSITAQK